MSSDTQTQLLKKWSAGDTAAKEQLMLEVYPELKKIANRLFAKEAKGHTLQATALVNEAYIKLCTAEPEWNSKTHFFGFTATLMRHLLVDHARSKKSNKRGGHMLNVTLCEGITDSTLGPNSDIDVIALNSALESLALIDAIAAQAIEQRFFAGLSNQNIADLTQTSLATIGRKIKFAKAFLYKQLN